MHQIPEEPEETVITTPFGLFEFHRMPFGLRSTAQQFMDKVFSGLHGYIDDLLVASA